MTSARSHSEDIEVKYRVGTFTKDTLTVVGNGLATIHKLTFRPNRRPKELDFEITNGATAGQIVYAIYRMEDDKLTICMGTQRRPTAFSDDGEAILLVLKRMAKPD